MKGYVLKYINNKKFGFLVGEDGNDYFFHKSEFKKQNIKDNHLSQGSEVIFTANRNDKGLCAKDCFLLEIKKINKDHYAPPNEIILSREDKIRGYELIDVTKHMLFAENRDPNVVRQELKNMCKKIGGNSLVNYKMDRYTDSKPGRGNGTYYFTVHYASAIPVVVGKKTKLGLPKSSLIGILGKKAKKEFDQNKQDILKRKQIRKKIKIITLILMLSSLFLEAFIGIFVFLILCGLIMPKEIFKHIDEIK